MSEDRQRLWLQATYLSISIPKKERAATQLIVLAHVESQRERRSAVRGVTLLRLTDYLNRLGALEHRVDENV